MITMGKGLAIFLTLFTAMSLQNCASSDQQEQEELDTAGDESDGELIEEEEVAVEPEPAPASAPSGVVRYVRSSKVEIRAQPDDGAQSLGQLRQGDHIFVNVQGDWAELTQGGYVPVQDLSSKAVARPKRKAQWNQP